MKTHDNQKPFQCTICNRGYNTAAALTSHMQNHKKQAALLGAPNLNYRLVVTVTRSIILFITSFFFHIYSPRSTGSASSTNSLQQQKRKYSPAVLEQHTNLDCLAAKRSASANSVLYCIYCTKSDFQTLEQLHAHIHSMHAAALRDVSIKHYSLTYHILWLAETCM